MSHAIYKVFAELTKHFPTIDKEAIELFGGTGALQTKFYAPLVGPLDIWDCVPDNIPKIRANVPRARNIMLCDTYKEIKTTDKKYDLIFVDEPFATNELDEHFRLFPDIFRIFKDRATLIIDVIPEKNEASQKYCDRFFNDRHCNNRKEFYGTVLRDIPIELMASAYSTHAFTKGFNIKWYYSCIRRVGGYCHYLVIHFKKGV